MQRERERERERRNYGEGRRETEPVDLKRGTEESRGTIIVNTRARVRTRGRRREWPLIKRRITTPGFVSMPVGGVLRHSIRWIYRSALRILRPFFPPLYSIIAPREIFNSTTELSCSCTLEIESYI